MKRVNTVTWIDGRVLTKLMNELQAELIEWQTWSYEHFQCRGPVPVGGDLGVLVASIKLRDKLGQITDRSALANTHPKS